MLCVEHDSLEKDVLDQMVKETREVVCEGCEVSGNATLLNRTRYCKTWIEILDKCLEKRLGGLDPSYQMVPGLQARLGSAIRTRKRLAEVRDEVERPSSCSAFLGEKVPTRTLHIRCPVFSAYFVHVGPYPER